MFSTLTRSLRKLGASTRAQRSVSLWFPIVAVQRDYLARSVAGVRHPRYFGFGVRHRPVVQTHTRCTASSRLTCGDDLTPRGACVSDVADSAASGPGSARAGGSCSQPGGGIGSHLVRTNTGSLGPTFEHQRASQAHGAEDVAVSDAGDEREVARRSLATVNLDRPRSGTSSPAARQRCKCRERATLDPPLARRDGLWCGGPHPTTHVGIAGGPT